MNKKLKRALCSLMLCPAMILPSCTRVSTPPAVSVEDYDYKKVSTELPYFESSDASLDFFLNDYFKRHTGWTDENGINQRVNSVITGEGAQEFFWQEWMSLSYYPFNSFDGFSTDRVKGLRDKFDEVPVDRYGYVWQNTDLVRGLDSTLDTGEHRMGWPFPTSNNSNGMSRSWDFNGNDVTQWSSNVDARLYNGAFTADVSSGVTSVVFTSPTPRNNAEEISAYYAPLLEIDVRMYTPDSDNVEDIRVWYTTNDSKDWSEDKCVSVNEKAFIAYDYTPVYEHLLFLPMYAEESYKSDKELTTFIREIKIEIVAKEGKTISGEFGLNYVRPAYDTRHTNNNSIFISSLRLDYDYTGDIEYLKANVTRARKAMNFFMQMYNESRHLIDQSYLVGHDSDKTSSYAEDRIAMSLGNGYWDISFMPKFDFQSNVNFYKAIVDLAHIEKILEDKEIAIDKREATVLIADRKFNHGTSEYTYDSESLLKIADDVLNALRAPVNDTDKTGFWSNETGRFVAGYSDAENKWYDYGYTMWNMDAIYYGVASSAQAKSIMDWISGKRIVERDRYGSQGEDIYFFELAPRANTYSEQDQYDASMFSGVYADNRVKYGVDQVQNGGAIMYTSFYDLMGRISVYGADDAFSRLSAIKKWYQGVYDYYVTSDNYNTHPDRFYWDYYLRGKWENPTGQTFYLQNGIKGIQERGGNSGGIIGVDGEFLESLLMIAAIPYGFFGIESIGGSTLKIEPELPSSLDYWKIENLAFNYVKYDLTIFGNSACIDSVRGNASGLTVQVVLDKPTSGQKVYVNGRETSNYTVSGDKVYVLVPLGELTVSVK